MTVRERIDVLPAGTAIGEAGFPQLRATSWIDFGSILWRRRGTGAGDRRLNTELAHALHDADPREKLKVEGTLPATGSPEQYFLTVTGAVAFPPKRPGAAGGARN